MQRIKIIAFTHKTTDLNDIGKLHIEESALESRLNYLKTSLDLDELCYLSTCNRVEFIVVTSASVDESFLKRFFTSFNNNWTADDVNWAVANASVYSNEEALCHLFNVASSLDSLVVGEREIITQVRNSYDKCSQIGVTGDVIRLAVKD